MNRFVKTLAIALAITGTASAQPAKPGTKPALTLEQYEKLVLGLADCKLKGYEIDSSCPGFKAMQAGLKDTTTPVKDMLGMTATLGQKLISHSSPAVRVKASFMMTGILGTAGSSQDIIVGAAAKEKDPQVLQSFVRTVSNDGAKNPKVAVFLLQMADHADKDVRLQAVYALQSSWNKEMKGGPEKLAKMAQDDKEGKVRAAACEGGGRLGNKVIMPMLEKGTAKPDDKEMYSACMTGTLMMFFQYPFFETTSQEAYKLFLKRLNATPRSENAPPWTIMGDFSKFGDDKHDKLIAWKKKATWFKAADMRKALSAVVADKKANWMGRSRAIESLVGLGATKAELGKLRKGLEDKGDDTHVAKKIDELLPTAK